MTDRTLAAGVLERWFTGRGEDSLISFLEGDSRPAVVESSASAILPCGVRPPAAATSVVEYQGSWTESGDEILVAGQSLELLDYVAAPFVDIVGPTVVRFGSAAGWMAFIQDADLARDEGTLPYHLCDPAVLLADSRILEDPWSVQAVDRIQVGSDGDMRVGLQGQHLDPTDALAPRPRYEALAGIGDSSGIRAALESRPWMALLVGALDVIRLTHADPRTTRVIGLGRSLIGDAEMLLGQRSDIVVTEERGDIVLANRVTRRRFRLDASSALVAESALGASSHEEALERVCAATLCSRQEAASAISSLSARLGVAS